MELKTSKNIENVMILEIFEIWKIRNTGIIGIV